MSRDPKRVRIDYQPGPDALAALQEAAAMAGPKLSTQALLDKLVLWGVWCAKREKDRPPPLAHGSRR